MREPTTLAQCVQQAQEMNVKWIFNHRKLFAFIERHQPKKYYRKTNKHQKKIRARQRETVAYTEKAFYFALI